MHPWIRHATLAPMLVAATFLSGCFLDGDEDDTAPVVALNIVETAQADPNLSLLVEAVVAADLATTLASASPKTVFAPTNAAFTALLAELGLTKEALFADKPLLTAVLTYHVLGSEVPAASVPAGLPITTLQGGYFKVDANGSALVITDGRNRNSNITTTDIDASNGVIHVVGKVLLPADKSVVDTAVALASGDAPEFALLVEALTAANLVDTLKGKGPFTVFATTDEAFAKIPKAQLDALLADKAKLSAVLTYHVVAGKVMAADVKAGKVKTVQGKDLTVTTANG